MSAVMHRESASLNAALEAAEPRLALRDAVREQLRRGQSRAAVLGLLAEFSKTLSDDRRAWAHEIMDVLEGWASKPAIDSFFEGLPESCRPVPR
jgi:hypothetical protein